MRIINNRSVAITLILSLFVCGILPSGCSSEKKSQDQPKPQQIYTCPMHPSVRLTDPKAPCPRCGMELVPVTQDSSPEMEISFSPETVKRMNFQTFPAQRKFVAKNIKLQGKLKYNETRLAKIAAWVGGRVERLYVDYTGMAIRKDEHMVELYSPELISAQQELLQSLAAYNARPEDASKILVESLLDNYNAAREKLRLLGLSKQQVDNLEKDSKPQKTITITAPISGIVTSIKARKGQYVKTGTELFTIADLSKLWLILEAYESDVPWIRLGQRVKFTTQALPGKNFSGTVAFISPSVDPQNHTLSLRVNVNNPSGVLRPGMLVTATIEAQFDAAGKIISPELKGKWICPMHPGEVKDSAGKCDICGMAMVKPESIGIETTMDKQSPPLIIPYSAVLQTGKRAVVYVEKTDEDRPTYELREIIPGPQVGSWYVVNEGLTAGELVVTNGAFKIDSERQLRGLPSMMSKDISKHDQPHKKHEKISHDTIKIDSAVSEDFKNQLGKCLQDYFVLSEKLADTDDPAAKHAAKNLKKSVIDLPDNKLKEILKKAAQQTADADNIKTRREAFSQLSQVFIKILKQVGSPSADKVYVIHCPMAFDDQGADWLQPTEKVLNPYFGSVMLRCGGVTNTIEPK